MRQNTYNGILSMFTIMKQLKEQTFYTYNHSASNPIVGRIVSINENEEKVRMYITSGTSYDGYKDIAIEELKNWHTSVEDLIEAADEAREEYYEEHKEMLMTVMSKNKFCGMEKRTFIRKIAEREDRANRALSV